MMRSDGADGAPLPGVPVDQTPRRGVPDFARIASIFDELVDLDPVARARALHAACAGRDDLVREIESLLDAHDRLAAVAPDEQPEPGVGTTVGVYRLVEKIGEGGMGEVYRADRIDGAFTHQVAVKLTRSVLASSDARRRFQVERQVLASLRHANIVRLFDGGTLPGGTAFVVMELVSGLPITRYCVQHRLALDARVRLMRDVCDAVQHAHQHAIVHRDLKPANILVTAEGTPKVLDFGVAKLLDRPAGDESKTVGVLPAPLTTNYASPEQLQGLTVTTASDVYALGVLLFEILSGARPYDTGSVPLDRVLEIVVHGTRPRPSAVSEDANAPLPYPRRRLRGDLDAIVSKALSHEVERRYPSASEMSADLTRWLEGQPVTAREPSAMYVLGRFAARHRLVVATAAVAFAAVLASSAFAWWQAQIARREQVRAERRFEDVRAIASRVIFDYQAALREMTGASDLRARMLADALRYLDALAADGPGSPALQLEIARGYINISEVQGGARIMSLGQKEAALASLHKAETLLSDLASRVPGFRQAEFVRASMGCYYARVDTDRAVEHATRCIAGLEPMAARRSVDPLVLTTLAQAYTRLAEAGSEEHARRAIEVAARVEFEKATGQIAAAVVSYGHRLLGWRQLERGSANEALRHGEASLAALAPILERTGGRERHMDHSFTWQLIGRSALALGDRPRARDALQRGVLLIQTALQGNPKDAFVQDRLLQAYLLQAESLEEMGDRRAAAVVYREAVERLASLTASLPSGEGDWTRGSLYAGHARLGFSTPPCDLLDAADRHLDAARKAGTLRPAQLRRADRIRAARARCGTIPSD